MYVEERRDDKRRNAAEGRSSSLLRKVRHSALEVNGALTSIFYLCSIFNMHAILVILFNVCNNSRIDFVFSLVNLFISVSGRVIFMVAES